MEVLHDGNMNLSKTQGRFKMVVLMVDKLKFLLIKHMLENVILGILLTIIYSLNKYIKITLSSFTKRFIIL